MDSKLIQAVIENLNSKYQFRLNVITKRIEFKLHEDEAYKHLSDNDLNSIWRAINSAGLKCNKGNIKNIINSNFSDKYDPFKDYFDKLPGVDEKENYIKELSDCIKLVDETEREFFEDTFRIFLRAVVACAYDNKPNHICLTLVGRQGIYKTTFLNNLCPASLRDKYLHTGSISGDKDTQIRLSSCFLINNDEFATLNKTDIETFKTLITQSEIHVRMHYAHYAETISRRASFVASLNKLNFLTDSTGNRRFFITEVAGIDIDKLNEINMDLVYAQAFAEYKAGKQFFFNDKINSYLQQLNQRFDQISIIEELLMSKFKVPQEGSKVYEMSATEIAEEIFLKSNHKPSETEIRKVGNFLAKHLYFQKCRRINGVTKRIWQVSRLN